MPVIPIDNLDDPRVAVYRNLKDRELAQRGGRFIAEGTFTVERLLDSDIACESVLAAPRRAEQMAERAGDSVPVYVASEAVIAGIVGFKFHRGVMACGVRPDPPSLDDLFPVPTKPFSVPKGATVLICAEVENHENLGSLMRTAAAFGVDAMVLGPRSCDPFWRRAIRVSMGAAFVLPIVRSDDLARDVNAMRERMKFEVVGSVLSDRAKPLFRPGKKPEKPRIGSSRIAVMVGPESSGLTEAEQALCDKLVTIPMSLETDSLNITAATAVLLYHYTQLLAPHVEMPRE